jgi:hypothetical protein
MTRPAGQLQGLRIASCAAGAAALLAAGCGSSGAKDAATTPTKTVSTATTPAKPKLTRADFIAQADSACKRVQAKQNDLRREAQGKQTSQLTPTLRKQAKLADGLAKALTALGAPSADATRAAAFIDSVHQIGVYSKALSNSIAAQHTSAAQKLASRLVRWRQVEHTLGESYGMKVCARGSSY